MYLYSMVLVLYTLILELSLPVKEGRQCMTARRQERIHKPKLGTPHYGSRQSETCQKPPKFFFVYFQENQYIMNHRYVEVPTITFLSDFL